MVKKLMSILNIDFMPTRNISTITDFSKDVKKDSIFFALDGVNNHGTSYIDEVISKDPMLIVHNNKDYVCDHSNVFFVEDLTEKLLPFLCEYYQIDLDKFKFIFLFSIIFVLSVFIFLNSFYQFGSPPNKEKLLSFKNSNNFDEGKFYNHYELPRVSLDKNNPEENESNLKNWFFPPKNKNPSSPLPSISFDKKELTLSKFSWLGHSTTLMNINDLIIMTDPVFNRASPIPIFGKPFAYENTTTIDDLPKISVVILSHDHYDHLDAKAIKAFSNNVDYFIVPLGVKGHLVHWGVESNKITELDWYESFNYQDINFTLTPAQHFSGRSKDL